MPRMGKPEADWNGLKLGFLKTVQPYSFSKLIPAGCSFKNNAQETYLFVSDLWFCHLHRGYYMYMAARGYEFYLRVMKVSLTSERSDSYIKHKFFFLHFRNSKIVQLKWWPIAKCLSQQCYETRIWSYKGKIKTFSVPKSQNFNEEEKNSITKWNSKRTGRAPEREALL